MRLVLTLSLCVAVSCGGDDVDGLSDLDGIYETQSWTLRTSGGCDSEGESILGDTGRDPYFAVYEVEILGVQLLTATHCPTVDECRGRAGELDLFGIALDKGSDSSGWTGSGATAGSSGRGECMGEARDFELEETADAEVTVSIVSTESGTYPEDDEGFCTTDGAIEAAEGRPCTGLERYSGTLVEAL